MTSVLHVATTGADDADGSAGRPFRPVNRAAAVARAGDIVVLHAGEYREWVKPRRGGLSDSRRITYAAAAGLGFYEVASRDEVSSPPHRPRRRGRRRPPASRA